MECKVKYFRYCKKKKKKTTLNSISTKILLKCEREIKIFGKQRLRKFITTRSSLQECSRKFFR